MEINKQITLAEIVKDNFHTADVFESYGLDFCCKGNRTIEEVCNEKNLDTDKLIHELSNIDFIKKEGINFDELELNFLIDYIINIHHSYVKKSLPKIADHLQKLHLAHGDNHPEIIEIENIFAEVSAELESHMMKEEKMLFPYIKKLVEVKNDTGEFAIPPFGNISNPIIVMEREHESAGNALYKIRELSSNYFIPSDACNTYKVLYEELKEFENDLHIHVLLENSILHPKAKILENEIKESIKI